MTIRPFDRRTVLAGGAFALVAARRLPKAQAAERTTLKARDGHAVPLWTWRATRRRIGIVAFSHGAQSSPDKYPDMVAAWTAAGYDVVAPLHVDSPDHPEHDRYPGVATWKARIEDYRAVSDHIGAPHIAAGHSYGGLTALVQGGALAARPEGIEGPLRDPRVTSVVAFSPPPPLPGFIDAAGYAALATPAFIQTGTKDILGANGAPDSWHGHLAAYDAAVPGGHRYALVLDGANHYFGGAICDYGQPGPAQTEQLHTAIRLSLVFMAQWGGARAGGHPLDGLLRDAGPYRLTSK